MPMHISPNIDKDPGHIATMCPITSSLSPATQSDILGILQREQDHAVALLSLSPLLSSLFVSYAGRAATLESVSSAPSPESEEWKALQANVAALQEENEGLKSENLEVVGKLEAATASHEAFRSQVSSLREVNKTQQDAIQSLRADLVEDREKYDQLVVNSNTERAALQIQVFDLEVQRGELKETVVEQQIKISKLERQKSNRISNPSKANIPANSTDNRKLNSPNITSSVPSSPFSGAELGPHTSPRKGKIINDPSESFSKVDTHMDPAGTGIVNAVKGINVNNIPVKISVPSKSGNECWTDEEQAPSPTEPITSTLAIKPGPEAPFNNTPELFKSPAEVEDNIPTTPVASLLTRQPQVPTPSPVPARAGPEKPLSLWERKKLKVVSPPATAYSTSGIWGDGFDAGRSAESIVMPTITGNCPSISVDTPRDQKGENQEETGSPVMEDEFDWANTTKKKKGRVASVAQTPSVPNVPDSENVDDAPGGGGGRGGKRWKKKGNGLGPQASAKVVPQVLWE